MLINLPNGIGKIKNKQDMHVCTQDLRITEASNHSNILLPKVRRLNLIFVPALITYMLCHNLQYHSNHGSHDLREALHIKTNTLTTKPRSSHSTNVRRKRQKLKVLLLLLSILIHRLHGSGKLFSLLQKPTTTTTTTATTTASTMYTVCPTVHYRANYQDVPFVVGTVSIVLALNTVCIQMQ